MEKDAVTDLDLILQTKAGTLSSFETLVKRYQKQLFGFAYRKLRDDAAADDVVQETFIRIYKNLESFDTTKPFTPWLYTIAKNVSLDIIRKGKHSAQLDWDIEDQEESIMSRIVKNEAVSSLWNAIRTLPEMYSQPLLGYYFADLSYRQLAYQLNMSENTIKTRLRRAKNYLKKELGRKGYG